MEKKPLVSVVIPTYKRPTKLNRALKSTINQTYENLEIIVVNDAPNTALNHINNLDCRIKLINHKENKGPAAARNTGIKNSKGKYIAFLDDDDVWSPLKLEKQIKKFEKLESDYGAIYTWYKSVYENGIEPRTPRYNGYIFENVLNKNFLATGSLLIKKECFEKVGLFDEKLKYSEDKDMWLRIGKIYKYDYIPDFLMKIYRDNPDRLGEDIKKIRVGKEKLIKKHKKDFKKYPRKLHKIYKILGVRSCYNGESKLVCSNYFKKSYRYNKKDLTSLFYYVMSYLPKNFREKFFKLIMRYYYGHKYPRLKSE